MRIIVSVGTHEQQFDRLVDLADQLAIEGHDVSVQYGYSRKPRCAHGAAFLLVQDLDRWMEEADIAIVHGGPATVLQALSKGKTPIVVPRDPTLNEHVDDHQLRFARHLQEHGLAIVMPDVGAISVESILRQSPRVDLGARIARVRENRSRLARSLDEWLGAG